MKQFSSILLFSILWCLIVSFSEMKLYIDPTGTYNLVSKKTQKGSDIYGYSGEIQVKVLTEKKIIMTFNVNKGAPTYNSGTFVDTLDYMNNTAIYTNPIADPSCEITFTFSDKGVTVKERTSNKVCGCGFEPGEKCFSSCFERS
jgi:hypothetical protein